MPAMSGTDFVADVIANPTPDKTSASWTVSTATAVMLIASNPEAYSKEQIVEAIQDLGRRMPSELVVLGGMNLADIDSQISKPDFDISDFM